MCKTPNLGIWTPLWGSVVVTHDLGWWLVVKSMVDFPFALIELFRYLLRFRSYGAKCVQLGCFCRGSTSLHSHFTWTGSSPINHSWRQKSRIPCVSLVLTQYRSVTDGRTDRQTDRRICCSIYSACKAMLCCCRNKLYNDLVISKHDLVQNHVWLKS